MPHDSDHLPTRRLGELATSMATAVDTGDRAGAVRLLARVEHAAGLEPTDPHEPIVVLARRFARAHGAVLAARSRVADVTTAA